MAYYLIVIIIIIFLFIFIQIESRTSVETGFMKVILLKDDDGRVFKPPSYIPVYAPEFYCDLPITANPREF